jgi:signal peptidase I
MVEAPARISVRDARRVLRETRALHRRALPRLTQGARSLSSEILEELEQAVASGDPAALVQACGRAEGLQEGALAFARKGRLREYVESIGFALGLALLLRAFVLEAFQIPSASMEPTLLIGDYLFVAKYSYGVRIPLTTRYLVRWGRIDRGDIIVFAFPVDEVRTQFDLACLDRRIASYQRMNGGPPTDLAALSSVPLPYQCSPLGEGLDAWGHPWRYVVDGSGWQLTSAGPDGQWDSGDDLVPANSAFMQGGQDCYDPREMGLSKNYIKRVIGLPGDVITIRSGVLHVNGSPVEVGAWEEEETEVSRMRFRVMTRTETLDSGRSVQARYFSDLIADFGPVTVRPDHVLVMGDNRDNSLDGRCWGQVPMDHIKGEAQFIFFSRDRSGGGIRWRRLFRGIE